MTSVHSRHVLIKSDTLLKSLQRESKNIKRYRAKGIISSEDKKKPEDGKSKQEQKSGHIA